MAPLNSCSQQGVFGNVMYRRQFTLILLAGAASCGRRENDRAKAPSSSVGLQDIDELKVQIQSMLERSPCSRLYRVESITIDHTRVVPTRPATLEVQATANLSSAEDNEDFTTTGCNTLSWSRRLAALRNRPSGSSVAFDVNAHFEARESGWRIHSADFDG